MLIEFALQFHELSAWHVTRSQVPESGVDDHDIGRALRALRQRSKLGKIAELCH
jgi:hypothetical protein